MLGIILATVTYLVLLIASDGLALVLLPGYLFIIWLCYLEMQHYKEEEERAQRAAQLREQWERQLAQYKTWLASLPDSIKNDRKRLDVLGKQTFPTIHVTQEEEMEQEAAKRVCQQCRERRMFSPYSYSYPYSFSYPNSCYTCPNRFNPALGLISTLILWDIFISEDSHFF